MERPYIGPSPDALTCDCCGKGAVEIKCPLCVKDSLCDTNDSQYNFCVGQDNSGLLNLMHSFFHWLSYFLYF